MAGARLDDGEPLRTTGAIRSPDAQVGSAIAEEVAHHGRVERTAERLHQRPTRAGLDDRETPVAVDAQVGLTITEEIADRGLVRRSTQRLVERSPAGQGDREPTIAV